MITTMIIALVLMIFLRFGYPYLDRVLFIFNGYASFQLYWLWNSAFDQQLLFQIDQYPVEFLVLMGLTLLLVWLWWLNFWIALELESKNKKT